MGKRTWTQEEIDILINDYKNKENDYETICQLS